MLLKGVGIIAKKAARVRQACRERGAGREKICCGLRRRSFGGRKVIGNEGVLWDQLNEEVVCYSTIELKRMS